MDPAQTARQCRHYAMCKIDMLGTGICPAGSTHHFVSHYPQGRMDIFAALAKGILPVTEGLVEIAESCTLCGICDPQCYFVTQLKPLAVARAIKEKVKEYLRDHKAVVPEPDQGLVLLKKIVGEPWATNDPAHLICYANDPCPISSETIPRYVVLPGNTREVQAVLRFCHKNKLPFAVRGNGSSVMGFVFSSGVVIDTARMRTMDFDEKNWSVRVGPGITSFELQKAAAKRGFRVNTAEPSASYCGNIMCSGIFSLFSAAYGTAADGIIDAEFVKPDGHLFRLGSRESPNLYAFEKTERPIPGVCTEVVARLHPVLEDESGLAVPFVDLRSALEFARELGRRRIGIGIGVLGGEYLSVFMSPTRELAREVKDVFSTQLGVAYLVLVLGDRLALDSARKLARGVVFEPELIGILFLGLPNLVKKGWTDILAGIEGERPPFELISKPEWIPVLETVLDPGPETLASVVDPQLRDFFTKLYSRPEMSDLLWLNSFRIISSRMGRDGHVVAFIIYVPMDDFQLIADLDREFQTVVRDHGIRGDFGFLTPLDQGKMAVLEWDFYLDHTDPSENQAMKEAMAAAGRMIEGFASRDPRVLWIRYLLNQGFSRKESFLYHSSFTD